MKFGNQIDGEEGPGLESDILDARILARLLADFWLSKLSWGLCALVERKNGVVAGWVWREYMIVIE